jgi:hypothetical protein
MVTKEEEGEEKRKEEKEEVMMTIFFALRRSPPFALDTLLFFHGSTKQASITTPLSFPAFFLFHPICLCMCVTHTPGNQPKT